MNPARLPDPKLLRGGPFDGAPVPKNVDGSKWFVVPFSNLESAIDWDPDQPPKESYAKAVRYERTVMRVRVKRDREAVHVYYRWTP